jgi:hypothetical protein
MLLFKQATLNFFVYLSNSFNYACVFFISLLVVVTVIVATTMLCITVLSHTGFKKLLKFKKIIFCFLANGLLVTSILLRPSLYDEVFEEIITDKSSNEIETLLKVRLQICILNRKVWFVCTNFDIFVNKGMHALALGSKTLQAYLLLPRQSTPTYN